MHLNILQRHRHVGLLLATAAVTIGFTPVTAAADSVYTALTSGSAYGNVRLRYESVAQDNAKLDATALTLRTRLGYATGSYAGLSATLEFEDNRVVAAADNYNNTLGKNTQYSVIADPETTEVDQAFLQYKQGIFTAKLGRQVITLDDHRFVGHVGFRQDRQTYDAISIAAKPSSAVSLYYAYLNQRNNIFAEVKDQSSADHLLNAAYTFTAGKLTGYLYDLDLPDTDVGSTTLGFRFAGQYPMGQAALLYGVAYATQDADIRNNAYSTDYVYASLGSQFKWAGNAVTAKLAYESLGSDNGEYGFATPLATLHKFNGWTDQFLQTPTAGLQDLNMSLAGQFKFGKLAVIYHSYTAEHTAAADDLGSELNLLYAVKFAKHYTAGAKYGSYTAGDAAFGKVDTDKLWVWLGLAF